MTAMNRQMNDLYHRTMRHIRARLLSGLVLLIPATATFFILRVVFDLLLGIVKPVSDVQLGSLPSWVISLFALLILAFLVYLLGAVTTRVFGRKLLVFFEGFVLRVPLVKSIYSGSKQIVDTFRSTSNRAFKSVAVIEYPQPGCFGLAFITNELTDQDGNRMFSVFMPTTPNPTSGFLFLIKESRVVRVAISVEDAIKMIISGGVVIPSQIMIPDASRDIKPVQPPS